MSDTARAFALAERLHEAPYSPVTQATPFEQRYGIAHALVSMLSECERHLVSEEQVAQLRRGGQSHHWQERLQLFRFACDWWNEQPQISLHQQRNRQTLWLAQLLSQHPQDKAWTLAGSTGSQPATRQLMKAILAMPRGHVWLPGCTDLRDDPAAGDGMAGISALCQWLETTPQSDPAEATAAQLITAAQEEEEAALAAALLREGLEMPDAQIACVSPDPLMLRRIRTELEAQGVRADSATGTPLLHHPQAELAMLLLQSLCDQQDSPALLACLKHPLSGNGAAWITQPEKRKLRGDQSGRSPLQLLSDHCDDAQGKAMLNALIRATTEFGGLQETAHFANTHFTCLAALMSEELCEELSALRDLLSRQHARLSPASYLQLFTRLLSQQKYFPKGDAHPRLHLLSPMEARLMRYDRLILAGLNEGSWPVLHRDGWLHPAQTESLGLPEPEAAISMQAHDFFTLLHAAEDIIITRSATRGGSESLPSRFLNEPELHTPDHHPMLSWLRQRPAVKDDAAQAPAARPPRAALPLEISATALELLMRDPYGFYARYVLKLKPAEALQQEPEASLRGSLLHLILQQFTDAVNGDARALNEETLLQIARDVFRRHSAPVIRLYWWPRVEALIPAIVAFEQQRRGPDVRVEAEVKGAYETAFATLSSRIDRLEHTAQGPVIIDYKTGATPSEPEIAGGYSPQLLLAALTCDAAPDGLYYVSLNAPLKTSPSRGKLNDYTDTFREGLLQLLEDYYRNDKPLFAQPVPARQPKFPEYAALERSFMWQG
jgi:ATP-dependent helicase/nuclease subunit B